MFAREERQLAYKTERIHANVLRSTLLVKIFTFISQIINVMLLIAHFRNLVWVPSARN